MARINNYPFYPADKSNYSSGRERPIKNITVHHSAGWENTLRYLWANPSRNGSSHFWVGNQPNQIEQYVDTANTAWTNGNWGSNNESITIEVRGDWRGYYDKTTLDNLENLMFEIMKVHGKLGLTYHNQVSDKPTVCPAELRSKGYALARYNNAVARYNAHIAPKPKPTPIEPKISYQKITPKRVVVKQTANLWDFNFTTWSSAKAVKAYGQGSVIDVVAIATNPLGAKYYMTAYSYNEGKIRATNGFNVVDVEDYVPPPQVEPPKVVPTWEAMLNPRKMRLAVDSKVTDLDTKKEVGELIPKDTDIDLVEKITVNGATWLRSKWASDNQKNWGIQLDRFVEVPEAPDVPPEPIPEPPLQTDPEPSQPEYPNWFIKFWLQLIEAIKKIIGKE